jgi:hypothetical protein
LTPGSVDRRPGGQLCRATFVVEAARRCARLRPKSRLRQCAGHEVVREVVDLVCVIPSILESIDFRSGDGPGWAVVRSEVAPREGRRNNFDVQRESQRSTWLTVRTRTSSAGRGPVFTSVQRPDEPTAMGAVLIRGCDHDDITCPLAGSAGVRRALRRRCDHPLGFERLRKQSHDCGGYVPKTADVRCPDRCDASRRERSTRSASECGAASPRSCL